MDGADEMLGWKAGKSLFRWLNDKFMFVQLNQVSPSSSLFSGILVDMCVIQLLEILINFGHLCNVHITQ